MATGLQRGHKRVIDESVLKNFNETTWTYKISELYVEIEKQDTCGGFFPHSC